MFFDINIFLLKYHDFYVIIYIDFGKLIYKKYVSKTKG